MPPNENPSEAILRAQAFATQLIESTRSLILATKLADGAPLASYAPFARDTDGGLIIAVSSLAAHGAALAKACQVGVLIIEDEASARQIFARTRLSFDCRVQVQLGADRDAAFHHLRARFGDIATMLSGLTDFSTYRLVPETGTFVMGFGAAFSIPGGRLDAMTPTVVERQR